MTPEDVLCEKRGRAVWMRLNRPAELNALTQATFDGCAIALDDAARDPEVMTVVVTGTGRAFCAGADLKFLQEIPPPQRDDATNAFAAVNGIATAGGMFVCRAKSVRRARNICSSPATCCRPPNV